jgi:hypothetical protein
LAREVDHDLLVEHLPERAIELERHAEPPRGEIDQHRERTRIEPAHRAELAPRGLRGDRCRGDCIGGDLGALGPRPRQALAEPRAQAREQRRQMPHVGIGVGELRLGERALAPVRPLLLLAEREAEHLEGERGEADLVADAGERGHQLRIDDVRHRDPEPGVDQAEILARRMRDDERMGRQGLEHGAQIDGERVEKSHLRNGRDDRRLRHI